MTPKSALLLVDVQLDFLPADTSATASHAGSLAVEHGRDVLPVIARLLDREWPVVVASQDYHPSGHISFASTHGREPFTSTTVNGHRGEPIDQMLWPDHCVRGTRSTSSSRRAGAGYAWLRAGRECQAST